MRRKCLLRRLVHRWGARAKHAVLLRISSNMLPQRATSFSDGPIHNHRDWPSPRPRRAVLALLKTRNRLTGKRGRPRKTLPKGVKVRLKNKGSQRHRRGPKRPKYQAPYPEHPDTAQPRASKEIHANHLEAFHTSLRRRCAAYRRRTNMYAKNTGRLQERLDVYWIVHNFVRVHFTTRQVPAVALGVLEHGLSLNEIFLIQTMA